MVDCYGMSLIIYGLVIDACYYSHKSNFHESEQSSIQFTSLINCIFKPLALLLKLAIVLTDLTFIALIYPRDHSLYL